MYTLAILALLAQLAVETNPPAGTQAESPAPAQVLVVIGAAGTPEFGAQFSEWSGHWQKAAEAGGAKFTLVGREDDSGEKEATDRERLQAALAALAGESQTPFWLVLIGHGTFDGQAAKFNLRGPDFTPQELAEWLAPMKRPVVVINCASASAPFLNRLAGENRIVITSTRSGNELNYARFGQYLSAAINDPRADLDKDGQVSLLEAYLTGCRQLNEFYDQESRLATEHALLDDNGDGLGTPATWFRGLRAVQRAREGATLDGTMAHQFHLVISTRERQMPPASRQRRDEIELAIAALRLEKSNLGEDAYFARLEPLLVELAQLYQAVDRPGQAPKQPSQATASDQTPPKRLPAALVR
jgi:hypothetical protein